MAKPKDSEELLVGGSDPSTSFPKSLMIFFIFHIMYLILPVCLLIGPFLLIVLTRNYSYQCGAILWITLYWGNVFTSKVHREHGAPWKSFENNLLVKYLIEWLPVRIFRKSKLSPEKLYVFGCHPHGTLAFNRAAVGFSTSTLWDQAFPGIKFRVLTASAAFYVPFIRELWLWSYCVDASKKTAIKVMRDLRTSVFVYPGGEQEQIETVYGKNRVMSSRKGFIRLAIEEGADLVPVYAFGETSLYSHSSLFLKMRKYLVKKFGVAIPLLWGEYGLMPYRTPVTLVFGTPIPVKQNSQPSHEEVNKYHQLFYESMETLYEQYSPRFGIRGQKLEMM
jgi:1-acyl-sn-glycerol-3-phosphate acyltransferase